MSHSDEKWQWVDEDPKEKLLRRPVRRGQPDAAVEYRFLFVLSSPIREAPMKSARSLQSCPPLWKVKVSTRQAGGSCHKSGTMRKKNGFELCPDFAYEWN